MNDHEFPEYTGLLITRAWYERVRAILTAPDNNVQIFEEPESRIKVDTSTMPETAIISRDTTQETMEEPEPPYGDAPWPDDGHGPGANPPPHPTPYPGPGPFPRPDPPDPHPDPEPDPENRHCWSGVDCNTGLKFAVIKHRPGYQVGDVVYHAAECWELQYPYPCPGYGGAQSYKVVDCNTPPCVPAPYKLVSCQDSGTILYTLSDLSAYLVSNGGTGVILWNGDCWEVTQVAWSGQSTTGVSGESEQDDCNDADCPQPCTDCYDIGAQPTCSVTGTVSGCPGASSSYTVYPTAAWSAYSTPGAGVACQWDWMSSVGTKTTSVTVKLMTDDTWDVVVQTADTDAGTGYFESNDVGGIRCDKSTGYLSGTVSVDFVPAFSSCTTSAGVTVELNP